MEDNTDRTKDALATTNTCYELFCSLNTLLNVILQRPCRIFDLRDVIEMESHDFHSAGSAAQESLGRRTIVLIERKGLAAHAAAARAAGVQRQTIALARALREQDEAGGARWAPDLIAPGQGSVDRESQPNGSPRHRRIARRRQHHSLRREPRCRI
jgi:hypothetical protein